MGKAFFLFLIFSALFTSAQDVKTNDLDLDFYGFIRNEFYIDSYKGLDAAHEQFYLVPLYVGKDANGEDINEQVSANLSAIATRLGVKINGPEIFGAKTSGNIEFDFGGIIKSEPTLLRIRHAYTALTWAKSKLLIGQTWHPFWGGSIFPTVAGLNTGAPFQCFSRTPQIRYDIFSGKFTLSGALLYELQYDSKAIESSNYTTPNQAKRNGILPEIVLAVEYKNKDFTLGAGALYNQIKPRMTSTGTDGLFKSTEFTAGKGLMAYAKYAHNKFSIISKGYYGQNMNQLTLLGGYGVASYDTHTGAETYTNYTNYTALVNALYGKKWQAGLLLGIGDNLGTEKALYNDGTDNAKTYGLLQNVKGIFRVSPSISLNISKIRLVAEYELTTADYGVGTFNFSNGLYADSHKTTNNRLNLMMMYLF
ncbi:MAG TPA: DcaP family trimeric outer membrane transporter [Prolixibacteraceae bacterium]|nr:DcaP family trimeric outer membrane transporter [Prolixibacteraceae bacterium]